MKANEKAEELIDKYLTASFGTMEEYIPVPLEFAKQCALICVDEIIKTDMLIDEDTFVETSSYLQYWQEVKQEILTYGGNK
jgi:hypothetical protein